ncbi:MAG: endonuclease NucS domain-containing protein [Candidatus Altiarchaeota archaeon]
MADLYSTSFRLQEDINNCRTILMVCNCSIEYWGRSRSVVGLGDRVVLIKPDSTLIIHTLSGFKPLNWMSPPTDTMVEHKSNLLHLYSQRTVKPYEEMKITVEKIHDYKSYENLEDRKEQELTHTERDMQDFLVKNPQLIDENFKLKSTGYRSPLGFFDLYGKIGGRYVVVELKSGRAGLPAALQLKRYRDWLHKHLGEEVDGMLMAPSITPNALVLLRKDKLVYTTFSMKQIKHTKTRKKTLEEWCNG